MIFEPLQLVCLLPTSSYTYSQHRSYTNSSKYKSDHGYFSAQNPAMASHCTQSTVKFLLLVHMTLHHLILCHLSDLLVYHLALYSLHFSYASLHANPWMCKAHSNFGRLLLFPLPRMLLPKIIHLQNSLPASQSLLKCHMVLVVKNSPTNVDIRNTVRSLSWEDSLEEGMATHSSTLAWRTPWTEGPGGLQSIGL